MKKVDQLYADFRQFLESFGPREKEIKDQLKDARAQVHELRDEYNKHVLMGADDRAEALRPQITTAEEKVKHLEEKEEAFKLGLATFKTALEESSDHEVNRVATEIHRIGKAEILECNERYQDLEAKALKLREEILDALTEMGEAARRAEQIGVYLLKTLPYDTSGVKRTDLHKLKLQRNYGTWPERFQISDVEFEKAFGNWPGWGFLNR
jgi:predicted  nucleic acid-binding Zn-ribbon protein